MAFTQIALDIDGPVATITPDREAKMNAFTGTMMEELIAAFDITDADDSVRAVIVTGRGRAGDAKEGVTSFLEKRTPVYPDKVSTDMPDFYPWWEKETYR